MIKTPLPYGRGVALQGRGLLDVLDCLVGGNVAGINAEAVAEAGDIVVGAVVHRAIVGADNVQTLHRGVVRLQGTQLIIRADAAEGAPGRRLALNRIEGAGFDLAEVPLVGAEFFVHAVVAVLRRVRFTPSKKTRNPKDFQISRISVSIPLRWA